MRDTAGPERLTPFTAAEGGVRLAVRLTPRADRNRLDGITQSADGHPALAVRLAAPPVEGAANAALIAFVATALKMRKADISIRSGVTARVKMLFLAGDPPTLMGRLATWIGQEAPPAPG